MRARGRHVLEGALRDHYRAGEAVGAAPRALVEAVRAELARPVRPGPLAIVTAQVRRIGAAAWVLHGALVLVVAALALSGVDVAPVAGAIGSALALASLTEVTRSRSCGMAELEAACAVNAQSVACARALVLGCADAAALLALVLLAAEGPGAWAMLAQGCAPYLVAAGAGLLAARRAASADATAAAVASATGVCAACVALRGLWPAAFAPATAIGWWVAAALAFAFAALEVRAWLRSAASAFSDDPVRAAAAL